MPFQKGKKRTGGRSKGVKNKITLLTREEAEYYGPLAIEKISELMKTSKDDRIRLAAAKVILDRVYGKPVQAKQQQSAPDLKSLKPTDNQIRNYILEVKRIAAKY